MVESFLATLKKELIYRRSWPTRREAIAAIHEYIEVFYNRQRQHSTIGGMSPSEFESLYDQRLCSGSVKKPSTESGQDNEVHPNA